MSMQREAESLLIRARQKRDRASLYRVSAPGLTQEQDRSLLLAYAEDLERMAADLEKEAAKLTEDGETHGEVDGT